MNCKECKEKACIYYKCYYHGFKNEKAIFSDYCLWTLKKPEDVKPEECSYKRKGTRTSYFEIN